MTEPRMTPTAGTSPEGPQPDPGPDLTGRVIGDFQVLRLLGRGGMGQVYLAEQVSLKRKVALKVLRADAAASPTSLKRFRLEAEAVAQATHANIIQVYFIGEHEGLPYMALEYVEGRNLRDYIARRGPPDVLLALSIMRQVAAALQRAAELGIVHRDIKPENILLTRKGEVKVSDFGLSRAPAANGQPVSLTQSGMTMGTPLYMSPEQVQGQPVDARTDIYGFGCTCYHMLSGEPPFRGATPFDVTVQHVQAQPIPLGTLRPDLPPELCAIVHKMMAKSKEARYQSAQELLMDLARVREAIGGQQSQGISFGSLPALPLGESPSGQGAPAAQTASSPASAYTHRSLWPWLVFSVIAASGVGGAIGWWWVRSGTAPSPTASTAEEVIAMEAIFSLQKREQFLEEAIAQYAHPRERGQETLGLGHHIELAVFYLDQWRLDDAEKLFKRLEQTTPEVKSYRSLGELGQAILLGLRSRPEESNRLFQKVLPTAGAAPVRPPQGDRQQLRALLAQNPRLRYWVATALDYNALNRPSEKLPAELDVWRRPTPPKP